ncbi:MAG: hypothetical protein WCW31_05705 [Patescibacteria group bacterium]|jgi:hypothetical protein
MRKLDKSKKARSFRLARARYAAKRHSKKWKDRKKNKKVINLKLKLKKQKQKKKPFKSIPAPRNFSLIENTDEVLAYFKKVEHELKNGENVILDISDVDVLTPATIALMVASLNDPDFHHDSLIQGNAPKKPDLYQLFTESGFYGYVKTHGRFKCNKKNLLHKEVHRKVVPDVAKDAALTGIRHVFDRDTPFEPLYEILVECMSNTNSHADLYEQGKCNWWLYAYSEPKTNIASYSFLDLGVGIFKSAVVQNYLKKLFKGTMIYKNINLVDDLLAGKLQSRADIDNEIRGKGIPQIVEHSKSKNFKTFFIIANDVKINLKTGAKEQLDQELKGTFMYWELQN